MNRSQAIESVTHFRIGASIIDAWTGNEEYYGAAARTEYYARAVEGSGAEGLGSKLLSALVGQRVKKTYHKKVHANELIPSISRAKLYIRENKLTSVTAKDKTDEVHMRLLIAKRVEEDRLLAIYLKDWSEALKHEEELQEDKDELKSEVLRAEQEEFQHNQSLKEGLDG